MKNKKVIIVVGLLILVLSILGGTFAYWSWQSASNQQTNVTFTVTGNFSCSADGGGNITSEDVTLIPASCTNSTYAIKRTVTTNVTNSQIDSNVYLDMWLNVDSISSGLAASENFKYALTTSSSSCTTGVVASGNFNGKSEGDTINLFSGQEHTTSPSNNTYYLYIWLDEAETSIDTMNQTFSLSLGGSCTNQSPAQTIYRNTYEKIRIGESIVPVLEYKYCFVATRIGSPVAPWDVMIL